MYRGTNPVIILNIKSELDFSTIDSCHVTLENEGGSNKITYDNVEIDEENKQIKFQMSQEETLKFYVGKIKLQLRIKLQNGSVVPSKVIRTTMNEILEEVVL